MYMNRNFGIHKYFNNMPTTNPEANNKPQGYSELDFLRNQRAYLEAKNKDAMVTADQKEANLARIKEIEARIKEIETPATAVLAKTVVDGKPQHGMAAQGEVRNAVTTQQNHTKEVLSATAVTASQTAEISSNDTEEAKELKRQVNEDAAAADKFLQQHQSDKQVVQEQTARSVSHTIEHKEVGIDEFRKFQKLAESGDANAQKELALMVFSDIDNKYMPKIAGLGWLGLDGGVVEKNNKIRLFGADGHKNEIGELQLYRILKNDQGRAMDFIRKNSNDGEQLTAAGVKRAQGIFIEKLNKLAEIQQLITGKVTNSSVDVPTVLAGNESLYIQSLLEKQENLQKQDTLTSEKKSRLGELAMSLGIALTIPGGYTRVESRDITPEDIEAGKNRPLQMILGKGPMNFTGKVAGLLPQLIGQINVNDRETKILQESHNFMGQLKQIPSPATLVDFTEIDSNLANNETVKFFLENQTKIPKENMVNVLGYNKALAMAKAEQGWESKGVEATLGIFGIGVGATAQKIDINYRASDGAIRKAVTNGVEVATSYAMNVDKLGDGRFSYTMKEVPGLWATLVRFDAEKGEYKENKDGTITFITEKVIDTRVSIEVLDNGDEKITYNFTENKNAVSTTEPVIKQTTSVDAKDVMTLRENAGKTLANNIYSWNRRDSKFDKIIVDISNKNYEQAYAALKANETYANVVKLASTNGKMDVTKMDTILTYTYGAKNVKNASTIDAETYMKSRTTSAEKGTVVKHEIAAMKEIMGVDVQPNEEFFKEKTSHTKTSAASKFRGQHISMSVVATPASLGPNKTAGTDRVDHFNSAIEISEHITGFDNPELKAKLLDAYSSRITTEITRINDNLGINVSADDYKALILGTKKPEQVNKYLAFVTGQEPKFFEARAMASHNVCNNLTYGLAFPNFTLNTPGEKKVMDPVTETRLESGSLVSAIEATELAIGVGLKKE